MKLLPAILALFAASAMGADVVLFRTTDALTWAGAGADRVASVASGAQDVTDGLIARWIMADGTGTTAADSSGTNTAYFVDTPVWTNRAAGKGGLYFDGVNDALRSSTLNLSSTNVITLCFWMNWKTNANVNAIGLEYSPATSSYDGFYVAPNIASPAGKFQLLMRRSAASAFNGGWMEPPTVNTWTHYVIVVNRTTGTAIGFTCYVNGTVATLTQNYSGDMAGTTFVGGAQGGLYFMSRAGSSLFGNGQLQDVRVYNRGISSNEAYTIWSVTQ